MTTKKEPIEDLRARLVLELRNELANKIGMIGTIVENEIRKSASEIIACAIGMRRDRWGGVTWEVVAGTRSAIAEEIGKAAHAQVMAAIPTFITQLAPKTEITKAMRAEYRAEYDRYMRRAISEAAQDAAKRDVESMLEAIRVDTKDGEP